MATQLEGTTQPKDKTTFVNDRTSGGGLGSNLKHQLWALDGNEYFQWLEDNGLEDSEENQSNFRKFALTNGGIISTTREGYIEHLYEEADKQKDTSLPMGGNISVDDVSPDPTNSDDPRVPVDPTVPFSSNIEDIYTMLHTLTESLFGKGEGIADFGSHIFEILKSIYQSMKNSGMDLSANEKVSISSQIWGTIHDFICMQYENAYNQATWIQQNEYNSPYNQVQRLIEGGISPAWYFGSLSSGNSSAPAGSSETGSTQAYVPENLKAINAERFSNLAGGFNSLMQGGLGGVAQFGQALANINLMGEQQYNIASMRPSQIAENWSNVSSLLSGASHSQSLAEGQRIHNDYLSDEYAYGNMLLAAQGRATNEGIDQRYLELWLTMRGQNVSMRNVDEQNANSLEITDRTNRTTLEKTDRDNRTQLKAVQMQCETNIATNQYSCDVDFAKAVLNTMQVTEKSQKYFEINGSERIEVSGEVGNKLVGKVKAGSTATIGGKTYTMEEVSTTRPCRPDEIVKAHATLEVMLRHGEISPKEYAQIKRNELNVLNSKERYFIYKNADDASQFLKGFFENIEY